MESASWANKKIFAVYRISSFVFLWILTLYHVILANEPFLIFFTNWGILFTTISSTFIFLYTIRFENGYLTTKTQDNYAPLSLYSPWQVWKWGMFCFETALTFELIVTLFFWAVLFPDMTESDKSDPFEFIDHIAPIVILIIEYSFNRIPFNMKHCPVSVGILVFYGIFNMAWTLQLGFLYMILLISRI